MCKKVAIFNFSPRAERSYSQIAQQVSNHYRLSNENYYHFTMNSCNACQGCNYECLTPGKVCPTLPEYLKKTLDAAIECDLIYFIVPNFCDYPNGNYFAFQERCVGYFGLDRGLRAKYMKIKKRFIIVSNTENDQFKMSMQQQTTDEPEILYMKSSKYNKRSKTGDMMQSKEAVDDLNAFLMRK